MAEVRGHTLPTVASRQADALERIAAVLERIEGKLAYPPRANDLPSFPLPPPTPNMPVDASMRWCSFCQQYVLPVHVCPGYTHGAGVGG